MTRLVLVRHAETAAQVEGAYTGSIDVEITDGGRSQADLLGVWARAATLEAIWSSPLRRARDTALPPSSATGLEIQVDDRLRELNFGVAEGRTLDQLKTEFPEQVNAFRQAPVDRHLPDGEDPRHAVRRVRDCLNEIHDRHADGRVLVVFHNTVLRLALCDLLGLPLNEYRRRFPLVYNCALTEVLLEHGSPPALLRYNGPIHAFEENL